LINNGAFLCVCMCVCSMVWSRVMSYGMVWCELTPQQACCGKRPLQCSFITRSTSSCGRPAVCA
jgi:hypothetical protein